MFHPIPEFIDINLPNEFPFPHYYTPFSTTLKIAQYLKDQVPLLFPDYGFGLKKDGSVGKMFGVLIVKSKDGKIGFLKGFSGRIADENYIEGFVPPVFNLLEKQGYFREKEETISAINHSIEQYENEPNYLKLKEKLESTLLKYTNKINNLKEFHKRAKAQRKIRRLELQSASLDEQEKGLKILSTESQRHHFEIKDLKNKSAFDLGKLKEKIKEIDERINLLKKERLHLSKDLQDWIFKQYEFYNKIGERKNLLELFYETTMKYPPSGAGDCAAPRLIQYALTHGYQIIDMAEFWYGASPSGLIRRHGKLYPACRGKCEPILSFLLQGISVRENPLIKSCSKDYIIEVIFESEDLIAVNKPHGVLSVPGKEIQDSVWTRLVKKYPNVQSIHRLDMATSGILLFAKNTLTYKAMQKLFSDRQVRKVYEALLDVSPKEKKGTINLPLSPSYLNRPMQVYDLNGKHAQTKYEILNTQNKIGVIFKPITGRTHQLRLHAAHHLGLNAPIKGDVLYGEPSDRLYLHAAGLSFIHPLSSEKIEIKSPSGFF